MDRTHHWPRLSLLALLLGCTRSAPTTEINRDDVEEVAAAHLQCPRERLHRIVRSKEQHVAWFEGCGREGQYRWGRGEVPFSGPKGWLADGVPRPAGSGSASP